MPPDDPEWRRAAARFRAFLAARAAPPLSLPTAVTAVVGHDEAEAHYLRLHPEDVPHRRFFRAAVADWGHRLLLRADWQDV